MKRKIFFALLVSAVTGLVIIGAGVPKAHTDGRFDLTVPEDLRGTWEVKVEYRDRKTGALVATDVSTAAVCPGEPVMPPLLNASVHCSGGAVRNKVGFWCAAKHSPRPGCNVFVEAKLDSRRDGDAWNGTGSWTARVVGNCEHLNFGEDFIMSGRRV